MNVPRQVTLFALLALPTFGCGSANSDALEPAATGGASVASGGSATGGAPAASGGNSTGGAASSAGGAAPSTGGASSAGAPVTDSSLLPWKVGNSWTYQVTASGVVSSKVTTVEAAEAVGGSGPNQAVMAFRVVTRKGAAGADESVSWQAPVGDKVVRYREQSYGAMTGMLQLEEHWTPYKLHVDYGPAHVLAGATWVEQYTETKLPVGAQATSASTGDTWAVTAASQSVTVPAGTFNAVVFQKTSGGGSAKTYWYARGVGKVKESGASQVEELSSYVLLP